MTNRIAGWTRAWAERSGVQHWHGPETASTNAVARDDLGAAAKSKLAPVLYIADHQTHGRGRGSNTWISSEGALLSSWSFHQGKPPQPIFSPLTGLAVYNAASKVWPTLTWSLKAPNDLYIGSKKVAGLLIETIERGTERRTIVGLGFNVLSAPESIPTATSLAQELKNCGTDTASSDPVTEADWSKFLQALLIHFMSTLQAGHKVELSKADAKALCEALNRRPNLEDKINKIGPKGELHTTRGVIDWQTL
ncbi:MAG: biotin synthetase [Bdellovibrionaceae bacterium]|nr:biotin synthetase [Pseudobdellovibrionaceae bacterium]